MNLLLVFLFLVPSAPRAAKPKKVAVEAAPVAELVPQRTVDVSDASRNRWLNDRFVRIGAPTSSEPGPQGVVIDTVRWKVLDASTYTQAEVVFPLARWSFAHASMWFGGQPYYVFRERKLSTMEVDLVDYDSRRNRAAFVVSNWNGVLSDEGSEQRFHYVEWALDKGEELFTVPIGSSHATHIGYDPGRTRFYLSHGAAIPNGYRTVLGAVDLTARRFVELNRIETIRETHVSGGAFHPSRDWTKMAFAEYTEKSWLPLDSPGKMVIVDTTSGESFAMDAPVSPYGVAWSPDGTALFVGSNEERTIDRYDLAARTITPVAKGLGRIAMFAMSPGGTTLFVLMRNRAIARFALAPFKAGKPIALASLFPGQKNYAWDWTTVSPDGRRLLLTKNANDEVAWIDEEHPAMSFYGFSDAPLSE